MNKKITATISAVFVSSLALAGCGSPSDKKADDKKEITISLVPSTEGEDLQEALKPLTDYLSNKLGVKVNGVVANDYPATVEALGSGKSDAIITDAGSLYSAMKQYDAKLILRDVRFGATSYASVAYTNNPDKYCKDKPVKATYAADKKQYSYCNGIEPGPDAKGQGPAATDALKKIDKGTKVALQGAASPAGYQYPMVAMKQQGVDTDKGITQVPVEGNNNAVLSVMKKDAEVGFGFWDARSTVAKESPNVADGVVAFAFTDMIPNGGVATSKNMSDDMRNKLADAMDTYVDSSDDAKNVMKKLVGLTDWSKDTKPEQIDQFGHIREQFSK